MSEKKEEARAVSRRRFVKYGAAGVVVAAAAAAGAYYYATSPTPTLPPTPTATATVTATVTPTPPSTAPQKITLKFWYMQWMEKCVTDLMKKCDEFEALNPGVTIERTNITWETGRQMLFAAIGAGDAPDVSQLASFWSAEFTKMGALVPLDAYVTEDLKTDILPVLWETGKVKGVTIGIPVFFGSQLIFYRKDILAEEGVSVPTTWEQLLDAAKRLTKEGRWGYIFGAYGFRLGQTLYPMMWQAGCPMWVEEDGKVKSVFNTPEGLKALRFYVELVTKHKVCPPSCIGSDFDPLLNGMLEAGKAAMMQGGMWQIDQIRADVPNLKDKWDVAPLTYPQGGQRFTYGVAHHIWVMYQQSKHKDMAWKLIEFLSNKKNNFEISSLDGSLPARQSNWENPFYKNDPQYMVAVEESKYNRDILHFPQWASLHTTVIEPLVQSAILQKITVDECAAEIDDRSNKILGM